MAKLRLLIVDDEAPSLIKDEIVNAGESVLFDRCDIELAHFVRKIPRTHKSRTEFKTAEEVLNKFEKGNLIFDLAFIDIYFKGEYPEEEGVEELIEMLIDHNPNCQIVIFSNDAVGRLGNDEKSFLGKTWPAIGKRVSDIPISGYNAIFKRVLYSFIGSKVINCNLQDGKTELLKILSTRAIIGQEELQLGGDSFLFDDLFFVYHKANENYDGPGIFNDLQEFFIDYPIIKEDSRNKTDRWHEPSTNFIYGIKEYYYQYFLYYSHVSRHSLEFIIKDADDRLSKLFEDIVKGDAISTIAKASFNGTSPKLSSKLNKVKHPNGRIPNADMTVFVDKLGKRLIALGMYFGLNFTCSGMHYLLNGSDGSMTDNVYKSFSTFLFLGFPDQLSTQADKMIYDFSGGDRHRQDKKIAELNVLPPDKRDYDKLFHSLASYEQNFLLNYCSRVKNDIGSSEIRDHVETALSLM